MLARTDGGAPHPLKDHAPRAASSAKHQVSGFTRFARTISHVAGHPATFFAAVAIVLVWAVTGPLFGYSDAWQLVINTGTTIITFLMVFLIQSSQNRDSLEIQLKLSELVLAMRGANDRIATIEDMSDKELEELHRESHARAQAACEAIEKRKESRQKRV